MHFVKWFIFFIEITYLITQIVSEDFDEIKCRVQLSDKDERCNLKTLVIRSTKGNIEELPLIETSKYLIGRNVLVEDKNVQNILDHTCFYQNKYQKSLNHIISFSVRNNNIKGSLTINGVEYWIDEQDLLNDGTFVVTKIEGKNNSQFRMKYQKMSDNDAIVIPKNKQYWVARQHENNFNLDRKKYIELYLIIDYDLYSNKFQKDIVKAERYAIDMVNHINAMYYRINISIVLVKINVWTNPPQNTSVGMIQFIKQYLIEDSFKSINYDMAHVLVGSQSKEDTKGEAYVEGVCSKEHALSYCHIAGSTSDNQCVTHEIAHNLGLKHNTKECECNNCIMNSHASNRPQYIWSTCTVAQLGRIEKTRAYLWKCLLNKPSRIIGTKATCGNGIIEYGEDCDANIIETCCDKSTCKFLPTETPCQSTTKEECKVAGTCSGNSSQCSTVIKTDGIPCDKNRGFCFKGKCGSRNSQCKTLFNPIIMKASNPPIYKRIGGDQEGCSTLWCSHPGNQMKIHDMAYYYAFYQSWSHYSPAINRTVYDGARCLINRNNVCFRGKCKPFNNVFRPIIA